MSNDKKANTGMSASADLRLRAATLGTIAYKEGRGCVPCRDSELMAIIKQESRPIREGGIVLKLMEEWIDAWEAAQAARVSKSAMKKHKNWD